MLLPGLRLRRAWGYALFQDLATAIAWCGSRLCRWCVVGLRVVSGKHGAIPPVLFFNSTLIARRNCIPFIHDIHLVARNGSPWDREPRLNPTARPESGRHGRPRMGQEGRSAGGEGWCVWRDGSRRRVGLLTYGKWALMRSAYCCHPLLSSSSIKTGQGGMLLR